MKKQAFILLFPHNKFVDFDIKKQMEFNRCIEKRYINKNFDFIIINYLGSNAERISVQPTKIEFADLTFFESTTLGKYPDFCKLAKAIKPEQYEKIMVGGFHCFDCVEKFAGEIYSINKNVVVDVDLTERFDFFSRRKSWKEDSYNPDLQVEIIKRHFQDDSCLLLKRYQNPIWGISNKLLEEIKSQTKTVW